MSLVELMIPAAIFNCFHLYLSSKIMNENIKIKSYRNIIIFLFSMILIALTSLVFKNFLRGAINFLTIFMTYYLIYNKSINKIFSVTFTSFVLFFVSEILYSILLSLLIYVIPFFLSTPRNLLFMIADNLFIGIIAFSLYKIPAVENLFSKLIKTYVKTQFMAIVITVIFSMFILANKNFLLFESNVEYVLNILLTILFCLIIFFLLKEKNENSALSSKYEQLFNYLENYEKELSKKGMLIHEFKNQIIAIKGFNDGKNSELEQYLQTIITDNKGDETKLLKDMENVPKGGLKGLIYYKLNYLNDEGINVSTIVNPNVKKSLFSKISPKLYKDIIKITGILLDNAIEASRISIEKQICLEIYREKQIFNFVLSNTYSGQIDIDKLDHIGYSTKGKGRGYGLTLANNILNDNECMNLKREVINNFYITILTINLKSISTK